MSPPPASLLRRAAAGFYDLLLLAGLLTVTSFALVIARGGRAVPTGNFAFQLFLLAQAAMFFAGFWAHGGQTLGMRTWHIRVETLAGYPPPLRVALLRFLAALLALAPAGLGYWWLLFDPQHRTWHDRLTGTRVVMTDKYL